MGDLAFERARVVPARSRTNGHVELRRAARASGVRSSAAKHSCRVPDLRQAAATRASSDAPTVVRAPDRWRVRQSIPWMVPQSRDPTLPRQVTALQGLCGCNADMIRLARFSLLPTAEGTRAMNRPHILVVEDNPTSRKLLRVALESEGYEVDEAEDGRAAISQFSKETPDVVLQDIVLPDTNGIDLAQKLRDLPGGAEVPIIAVTGLVSRSGEMELTA